MKRKESDQKYNNMQKIRNKLPAHGFREKLVECVRENQVVVVTGQTGCGKSTQVPQFIFDAMIQEVFFFFFKFIFLDMYLCPYIYIYLFIYLFIF